MAGHHLLSAFAEQRPRGPRSVEIVCAQGTQETMSYTCAYMSIHIISLYIYIIIYIYMITWIICTWTHVYIIIYLHVVCIIMYVYTLFLVYSCISIEHWCHMLSHPESTALSLGFATWHRWCEVWQACDAANLASQNFSMFERFREFALENCYRIVVYT